MNATIALTFAGAAALLYGTTGFDRVSTLLGALMLAIWMPVVGSAVGCRLDRWLDWDADAPSYRVDCPHDDEAHRQQLIRERARIEAPLIKRDLSRWMAWVTPAYAGLIQGMHQLGLAS